MSDRNLDWLAQAERDLEHAPKDFYTQEQAKDAVSKAGKIISWCVDFLRSIPA